mmetsp:Transcript_16580/g.19324  ORF Transcript_16580/g.19324 Transcript_16580/m.19324 type:complete len:301 (+) Transcript_16580:21-923(+)
MALSQGSMIYYNKGYCVFCHNKNVDLLANNTFFTAKDCGHQICESCKPTTEVNCPSCGISIKKSGISKKSFEQLEYERERKIRLDVMNVYNLQQDDFDTLKEFYDYQEEAETLIYNKIKRINQTETDRLIVEQKHKNHDKISENRLRLFNSNREIENEIREKKLKELKLLIESDYLETKERADRQLELEEQMLVCLGELECTTLERKRSLEREKKRKEYESHLAQGGVRRNYWEWVRSQGEKQPEPMPTPGSRRFYLEEDTLSRRKIAGGYNDNEAVQRTTYLMTACLFELPEEREQLSN